mmetsp:Transcript_60397/g.148203  ORF Transcript_60397/g.148203 Transcript_60397/m.148203 type:complete len:359 (+) Transcript_60397:142-1218(+)
MTDRRQTAMTRRGWSWVWVSTVLLLGWPPEDVVGFLLPRRSLRPPACPQYYGRFPFASPYAAIVLSDKKELNIEPSDLVNNPGPEDSSTSEVRANITYTPNKIHRALHEAKHRTKDKVYSVAAGKVTDKFHSIAKKGSIRKRLYGKLKHLWQQGALGKRLSAKVQRLSTRISARIRRRKGIVKMVSRLATSAHVIDRGVEQGSTLVAKTAAKHTGTATTSKLVTKYAGTSGERAVVRVAQSSSKRLSVRLAKGLTIALPVVGGIFAVALFRQDWQRLQSERAGEETLVTCVAFFAGAIVADFVDVLLHFFLAFGLLSHTRHRHWLALAEEWSIGCAAVSTACAVIGEILSFRYQSRRM